MLLLFPGCLHDPVYHGYRQNPPKSISIPAHLAGPYQGAQGKGNTHNRYNLNLCLYSKAALKYWALCGVATDSEYTLKISTWFADVLAQQDCNTHTRVTEVGSVEEPHSTHTSITYSPGKPH